MNDNDSIMSLLDVDENYTIGELMITMDAILKHIAPEGKTIEDFTGGYIQQLKNSTRFTAFFGTKEGTNNKATAQYNIPPEDMDNMYLMLKAKIIDMNNVKSKVKMINISEMLLKTKEDKERKKKPFGK